MEVKHFQHCFVFRTQVKMVFVRAEKKLDKSAWIVIIWQRSVNKLAGQHCSGLGDPWRSGHCLCHSAPAILEWGRGQDRCWEFELKWIHCWDNDGLLQHALCWQNHHLVQDPVKPHLILLGLWTSLCPVEYYGAATKAVQFSQMVTGAE